MKIVVMGGSFNPPTIAHLKMMGAALDQLGAEKGFFVPTADKSLRRKMRRAGFPEEVLSEQMRLEMLQAMAQEDSRLTVTDVEFQHPKHWYAQETMGYIQEQYPEAELYFLIGSDNLENYAMETMSHFREVYPEAELYYLIGSDNLAMFLRSKRLTEFLEKFHFAVVVRDGEDTEPILRANADAWERKERFHIIPSAMKKDGVSSTAVRQIFRTGGSGAEEMLHPKVMELMKEVDIWPKE